MLKTTVVWAAASALAILIVNGCTPEAKNEYSEAGSHVTAAARETGKAISADTKKAADEIKADFHSGKSDGHSGAGAKTMLSNDETSAAVKQAILGAKNLKTHDLRVDTNNHQVTLHGSVEGAAGKNRIDQITKNVLGSGYHLNDDLTVSGS